MDAYGGDGGGKGPALKDEDAGGGGGAAAGQVSALAAGTCLLIGSPPQWLGMWMASHSYLHRTHHHRPTAAATAPAAAADRGRLGPRRRPSRPAHTTNGRARVA